MRSLIDQKVKNTYQKLAELSKKTIYEIPEMKYLPCGYKSGKEVPAQPDPNWKSFYRNDFVQGKNRHFWFYTEYKTPAAKPGKEIVLELTTGQKGEIDVYNPQGLLYLNGEMVSGFDINHRHVALEPDTEYKILLYFYTADYDIRIDVLFDVKEMELIAS